jgi:hypothetical protein
MQNRRIGIEDLRDSEGGRANGSGPVEGLENPTNESRLARSEDAFEEHDIAGAPSPAPDSAQASHLVRVGDRYEPLGFGVLVGHRTNLLRGDEPEPPCV